MLVGDILKFKLHVEKLEGKVILREGRGGVKRQIFSNAMTTQGTYATVPPPPGGDE